MRAKYINPFTDFGFKKLFGEEVSKDLLIDFLNGLLPEHHKIKDLQYNRTEQFGNIKYDRKAVFDIYCTSQNGDKFIVELQKAKQNFFKDRSVFYATFPIREQADKGEWNFELSAVYCIGILDFVFEEDKNSKDYIHTVKLKNQNNKIFYDKLTFIYIEMPNFNKKEEELDNRFDKWLYFFKNLENFDHVPQRLKDRIFQKAFEIAEIARFVPAQMDAYEESLKVYRDLKNVIDYAIQEATAIATEEAHKKGMQKGLEQGIQKGMEQGLEKGREEGIQKGKNDAIIAIGKNMKLMNMPISDIVKVTGLTIEEINKL